MPLADIAMNRISRISAELTSHQLNDQFLLQPDSNSSFDSLQLGLCRQSHLDKIYFHSGHHSFGNYGIINTFRDRRGLKRHSL